MRGGLLGVERALFWTLAFAAFAAASAGLAARAADRVAGLTVFGHQSSHISPCQRHR